MAENQLWGGRFKKPLNSAAFRLGRSIDFDIRLLPYDLQQSRAYLNALKDADVITATVHERINDALQQIEAQYVAGTLEIDDSDEDVHGLVERLLVNIAGTEASTIRTGRSRNDQVATDFKLFLFHESASIQSQLLRLIDSVATRAEELLDVVATSYTHTQRAQPILFSQELLKHGFALERNYKRFGDWQGRHNTMPLGSGASAGSALPLDFKQIAHELGFVDLAPNSLDATSSRDFVSEFLFICAQISIDLSRIAEEIILWSTSEFGFVTLPDDFSTGSSLMPQKRNPDFAELTRGKTGRVIGNLVNMLTVLKALPFGYNRDLQEDKFPAFDSIDTLQHILPAFEGLFTSLKFNSEKISQSVRKGHVLATDIAEWLVEQGVAYKEAHEIVGKLVVLAENLECDIAELSLVQLQSVSTVFVFDISSEINLQRSIEKKASPGGTNRHSVMDQISRLRNLK